MIMRVMLYKLIHQGLEILDVFLLIVLRILEYKVHTASILEEQLRNRFEDPSEY